MTVGRRVIAVFALSGACWVVLGLASLGAVSKLVGTSRWHTHSQEVLTSLHGTRFDAASASRAVSSFVLTGTERHALAFDEAVERMRERLTTLERLSADNPEQVARLTELRPLLEQRVTLWRQLVRERRDEGADAARLHFEEFDREPSTRMRELFLAIQSTEEVLLAQRGPEAARTGEVTSSLLLLAMALGALIMAAGGAYLTRSVTRPVAELTRATKELGEGTLPAKPKVDSADELGELARAFHEMAERRTRNKQQLLAANKHLDALIENLPSMVFIKDGVTLCFLRINRAGEELLGIKSADLVGKSDYDFFPSAEAAFFQEKDRTTLREGTVVDIPEEPVHTARGIRWLHTRKVPVNLGVTGPVLVGISEDITERKLAADALRSAKETAEAAARELEAFSYSVSHDLRAPLRAIDGFSLALVEDYGHLLDAEAKDYVRRVRAATQGMGELIDSLLKLARVSRTEVKREQVDLGQLASAIGERLKADAPGRSVELKVHQDLQVHADAGLVRIALENLLNNAWKFSAKKPKAVIEVGRDRDAFYVRDNGAGFEMARADKLFTPFQRLHRTADFEGTGVGLATVNRIILRHGGRIWVEAHPGEGATFRFTLSPAAPSSQKLAS